MQIRRLVTVDGKETLTDWEDIPEEADGEHQSSGTFIGTWKLYWERNDGMNHLSLYTGWQNGEYTAFSEDAIFGYADTETLRMRGHSFLHLSPEEDDGEHQSSDGEHQSSDGEHQSSDWITYRRGEVKPFFPRMCTSLFFKYSRNIPFFLFFLIFFLTFAKQMLKIAFI